MNDEPPKHSRLSEESQTQTGKVIGFHSYATLEEARL